MFPVILYAYDACSSKLRDKYRLRVFEYRVLRNVFGCKREVVTRKWSKLHNEELHDLYYALNNFRVMTSRQIRLAGHVARMRGGVGRGEFRD